MQANDAWSAVAELAASQHGAFHRSQAADNKISNQRLRRRVVRGELRQPLRDVFVFAYAPLSWKQDLIIVALAGGVISHRSAARLHDLSSCPLGLVEATVIRGHERNLGDAIMHRTTRLDPADITTVDGITCTSIAKTLVDLGAVAPADHVEKALDAALLRRVSDKWIDQTADRSLRPGKTGWGVLAAIQSDPGRAGELPESWFERLVQRLLQVQELPTLTLQFELRVRSGIRRLDLAFPDARLGIEAHSRMYHHGRVRNDSDHLRDLEIAAVGWDVIYLTWTMVQDPDGLVDLVVETYRQRLRLLA